MNLWFEAKQFIEHSGAISPDALHVLVGTAAFLLACAILNRPVSSWTPWLIVFALLLFNEAVDLWVERWPSPGMQFGEGFKDVLLTMVLPTLLLVLGRTMPRIFVRKRPDGDVSEPEAQ